MAVELEKRLKSVLVSRDDGDDEVRHTFARRAEAYYSERPQLLSLLQQLYAATQVRRRPNSDNHHHMAVVDKLVEEVVMGGVQVHLLEGLAKEEDGGGGGRELRRKVELQRSLVEVLESERLVLLKENASLRYDNQALAWQAAELGTCLVRIRRDQIIRRRERRRGVRAKVGRWMRRLRGFVVCGGRFG